jgi:hypothetical protein
MNQLLVLGLAALVVAGCKSHPLSPVISPRIIGQVLAADTGKPLADVKILSGEQARALTSPFPEKGGERLMTKAPVETDADGRFVLEAQRALTPFRGSDWFSLRLSFEHPGYDRYLTNYSYLNLGTNTLNGQTVLDAGVIRLQPETKELL